MNKFLTWTEEKRIAASFIRSAIYVSIALIISRLTPNGPGFLGALLAGAYVADFTTWLGFHLLQIADHGKAFALKAIPNVIGGITLFEILRPLDMEKNGVDIGIAFIPFMLIFTIKVTYYLFVWDGIVDSDSSSDE